MSDKALPVIEPELCNACGDCVEVCPENALVVADGVASIAPGVIDCTYCGACEEACPTGAIGCPYEIVIEG